MSKTATIGKEILAYTPAIFNTMRILKKVNPGDCYYENYLGMRKKYGDFIDLYHVLWSIGSATAPRRILEIGTRTGISLCQLLSSYVDNKVIERVVCVDPFDEWTSANLVRANLRYLNLPVEKVDILEVKSGLYFAEDVDHGTFDFILVDGDHTKEVAAADLESAHKLLESSGSIVMDDLSEAPGECALLDVWTAFCEKHKDEYIFLTSLEGKGVGVGIKE